MNNLPNKIIIIGGGASIKPYYSQLQPVLAPKKSKRIRTCPICLKDSIFPLNAKKYCSKECSLKAIKLGRRKNYQIHRQFHLDYAKKQRKSNPNYQKDYNRIHKNKINKQRCLKRKITKQLIKDKLIQNVRSRVRDALKGKNKAKYTLKLIGCTIKELKQHLESHFTPGMSWKNYGKWHIDHIRPCCSFDLSKYEEQAKCFNYKNLQPLWASENLKKGANYDSS